MPRIAGLLMVHDDSPDIVLKCLDSLALYCTEGVMVNANECIPMLRKEVTRHSAVRDMIYTQNGGRWNQGRQRDRTLRMVDEMKPDICLFLDSDEVFYQGFGDDLDRFVADPKARSFWFNLLYLWDSPFQYRRDGLWKTIHHVRAFKWRPDLTFLPYPGYSAPRNYINLPKGTRFHASSPLLHFGYLRQEDRERKAKRGNCAPKSDDGMIVRETPRGLFPDKLWKELKQEDRRKSRV